ncbi:hypothetical protein Tco_1501789 [Tanacetum coccineum]
MVIRKLKDMIKSLSGKDSVENVKKDIDEIETINIELEHSVAKLLSKNENLRKYVENSDLNAQLQEKVFAIAALKNKLRKLKGKNIVETAVSKPSATIAQGMFKLDIEPISHIRTIGMPMRFTEPDTSSRNILKQADSLKTKDSNKPLLTSTGVKPTTSASGSKPSGNTKNNRITRPPSNNHKNKLEEHPRKVKSSFNKTNSISEPISSLERHPVGSHFNRSNSLMLV